MPINQPFQVFTTNANDLLNLLIAYIPRQVNNGEITHQSAPADLEAIKSSIFKFLWQWDRIEVFDDTAIKDYQSLSLSHNEASQVLGNFSFSMSSNTTTALYITYGLRIVGDLKALKNTVKYTRRYLNIKPQGGMLLFYSYCQGTIEQCAPAAKIAKANIVDLINSNQKDVDSFFAEKKNDFELLIENEIQKAYKAAVDKNKGLDLL